MRLLVIGGTSFLGRSTVRAALDRGDHVTTYNRGVSGRDLDGVEALRGDRDDDAALAQLAGREFDGVVDTCGFVPRVVGKSARLLRDAVGHYVFVSSISASGTWPAEVARDDDPGPTCSPDAGPDDGDYGELKAGCERAVARELGDRATVARAGLIIGPYENVGRQTWWLSRMARGGEVLAPGDPDQQLQLVDARDLAAYFLHCIDAGVGGTYNATAATGNTTMGGWLAAMAEATGGDARLTWVGDELLVAHEVEPWTELPLWMPLGQDGDHVWDAESGGAARTGLVSRPVVETVRDTWAWMQRDGVAPDGDGGVFANRFGANGITPEREQAILAAHHAQKSP